MTRPIEVIGFDLDDTLWDVRPVIIAAEQELARWLHDAVPGFEYLPERMREHRQAIIPKGHSTDLAGTLCHQHES